MQLAFLGIGAAFFPEWGSNCAFVQKGDRLLLLDCGESVFEKIVGMELFKNASDITIAITHTHADHIGSLPTLCLWAKLHGVPVTVVSPDPAVDRILEACGAPNACTRASTLQSPDWTLTPVPVEHASTIASFGYRISDTDETIYYSGDAKSIPEDILTDFLEGRIKRIYQDTCTHGAVHMTLAALSEKIPPAMRHRVTTMHYNCDFRAKVAALGFAVGEIDRYLDMR